MENEPEWICSGTGYFKRLEELIDASESEIHLQTYIFASDETGTRIAEALIRASKRNVKIFLLVDAFGSQSLSSDLITRMKNSGIELRKFGRLFSRGSIHIGRRMHHKITVIDGFTSIVGGINISDNYNDTKENKAWLDFAVIMYGEISKRLLNLCRHRWFGLNFSGGIQKKNISGGASEKNSPASRTIRIRRNDFIRNKNEIAISYKTIFRHSQKSIVLVGGYFLPGGRTRRLIKNAIKRGVNIKVVLSEKSDVRIFILARKYLYAWLIRNGIHVFIYNPANVHGKVIISDEKFTSIGSYDLNNLSTYSNIELNVDIKDDKFSSGLALKINQIIENDCSPLNPNNMYKNKTLLFKFFMWVAYRFVKTLFVLSVVLAGKKEKIV